MSPNVTIYEEGRSGTVVYAEDGGRLSFYWEYGGGDAVAIAQCGDAASWKQHPWALERRAAILRFVAAEVIRQRAPSCRAEIDDTTGDIVLRQVAPASPPGAPDMAWMRRLRALRSKFALYVLAGAVVLAGVVWVKQRFLVIDPGPGSPIGLAGRTSEHIAVLIRSLEAYTPSLHRDASKDTHRVELCLFPLDGSAARTIPVATGLSFNTLGLAKILGRTGDTLWFDAAGLRGLDLGSFELLPDEAVERVDPSQVPRSWSGSPLPPRTEQYLAAGLCPTPDTWLGLHSTADTARALAPGRWLSRVVRAEETKERRRFHRGLLEPEVSPGRNRIVSMTPLGEAEFVAAAFLRIDDTSEPIRLVDPPSSLMLYKSDTGLNGTLMMARVDDVGASLWTVETGIEHFGLQQILPGVDSVAFVGTRPPVPDQVSEPLLVIVDYATGQTRTESLWR